MGAGASSKMGAMRKSFSAGLSSFSKAQLLTLKDPTPKKDGAPAADGGAAQAVSFEALQKTFGESKGDGCSNREIFDQLSERVASTTSQSPRAYHTPARFSVADPLSPGLVAAEGGDQEGEDNPFERFKLNDRGVNQSTITAQLSAQNRQPTARARPSPAARAMISDAMRGFFYMSSNLGTMMDKVTHTMVQVEIAEGETLITEGEQGDLMYVVEAGLLNVIKKGKQVDTITPGMVVGELALVFGEPRSATIIAAQPTVLWSLDRIKFQTLQAAEKQNSRNTTSRFLCEVACLRQLSRWNIRRLASVMKPVEFQKGEVILREGEEHNQCFLIESGEVEVSSTVTPYDWTADAMEDGRVSIARLFGVNSLPIDPASVTAGPDKRTACMCRAGCFLGRSAVMAAARIQGTSDVFDTERNVVKSSLEFRAMSTVRCTSFTFEQFEAHIGPISRALTLGVREAFGSEARTQTRQLQKLTEADFRTLGFLGKGSFGVVMLAECTNAASPLGGKLFAVKSQAKSILDDWRKRKQVADERDVLEELSHPFILRLEAYFQNKNSLFLVTEYRKSLPLFEILYPRSRTKREHIMPERVRPQTARFWSANIASALYHMHTRGIAYRDLKPENVLVDEDGFLIVIDLGFAKRIPYTEMHHGVETTYDEAYTLCGTIEYLAPEFFVDGHGHTHAVDFWAFGCLVFEMVQGRTPFVEYAGEQDYRQILKRICLSRFEKYKFPKTFDKASDFAGAVSLSCRQLIAGLLEANPNDRLGNMAQGGTAILNHGYFQGIDWRQLESRQAVAPWHPVKDAFRSPKQQRAPQVPSFDGDQSLFADW